MAQDRIETEGWEGSGRGERGRGSVGGERCVKGWDRERKMGERRGDDGKQYMERRRKREMGHDSIFIVMK